MEPIKLKCKAGAGIMIGDNHPIIVNCNVGINSQNDYINEIRKIELLFNDESIKPDTMMDLSICNRTPSIAKHIIDTFNIPVGIVPSYSVFSSKKGIPQSALIDSIIKNAEDGISFMTMHFTADWDTYQIAKKNRKIPVTSRGGAAVLSDIAINKKKDNVYIENIDSIIALALKYSFVISLGTTFRPAGIIDACDEAHIMETCKQKEICHYIQKQGVGVIVENVGHIDINKIHTHSKLLREINAPIMPLGPIPIDSAVGNDHIAAAIGAAFMGYYGCAHIINAISPTEHLTSIFTYEDMKRALSAAKIAAQSVNINNFVKCQNIEHDIYVKRAIKKTCLIGDEKNCTRCDILCPLKM